MIANYVSRGHDVNDFVPGSTMRSMLEAFASAVEECYSQAYLGFRRALREIPRVTFDLARKEGTQATAVLTFTKETASASEVVTVPSGTRVSDSNNLVFATSERLTIPTTSASGTVNAQAIEVGRRYNVASGALSTLDDAVVGIERVTNSVAATGGEDTESELDYNFRFNRHVEGLGRSNAAGLEAGALSVDGITDAKAIDLDPPVSNVNVRLYVDNNSTTGVLDSKLTEVRRVIDGDGTEAFPGYRAGGVNVSILKPTIMVQNLAVTVSIGPEFEIASMNTLIERQVAQFINRLRIGTGLKIAELLALIVLIPGVRNISITTPASDVDATESQVIRMGTFTPTTTRVSA